MSPKLNASLKIRFFFSLDHTLSNWIKKYGWKDQGDLIFIASQDENIKTKNITEKIDFDSLSSLMSACL